MKIVVAGGTGFVGKALLRGLAGRGDEVVLLSRGPETFEAAAGIRAVYWDGRSSQAVFPHIGGAEAVVNLAGENVASGRWSAPRKERILSSRVDSTRALVEAIGALDKKPAVLVNASAVGYYGNVDAGMVTEESPSGEGFLAEVCRRWEEEAARVLEHGTRAVMLRIGIVLEKDGGALSRMILPFRLFAGGPLGNGRHWFPWIHRDDVVGAILHALDNNSVRGAVNATAPEPVRMREFCVRLGRVLGRPSWARVPAPVLRFLVGEMADDMLLAGARAVPAKLRETGYRFLYPELDAALAAILG